jgi:hypothetical protein
VIVCCWQLHRVDLDFINVGHSTRSGECGGTNLQCAHLTPHGSVDQNWRRSGAYTYLLITTDVLLNIVPAT